MIHLTHFLLLALGATCVASDELCAEEFETCEKTLEGYELFANLFGFESCLIEEGCDTDNEAVKAKIEARNDALRKKDKDDECQRGYEQCQVDDDSLDTCTNHYNKARCLGELSMRCDGVESPSLSPDALSEHKRLCDPDKVESSAQCKSDAEECERDFITFGESSCDNLENYVYCIASLRCPRVVPASLTAAEEKCGLNVRETCDEYVQQCNDGYEQVKSEEGACSAALNRQACLVEVSTLCLRDIPSEVYEAVDRDCAPDVVTVSPRCEEQSAECERRASSGYSYTYTQECENALGVKPCLLGEVCPPIISEKTQKAIDSHCGAVNAQ